MEFEYSGRHFVETMLPAVRHAASLAQMLEGRVKNEPKSGSSTVVKAALTLADSIVQETILVQLLKHFPDVALFAEEDTPTVNAFPKESAHTVTVDPIDGTLYAYLERKGPYAVMIGLAHENRYIGSLVALPRENLLFSATDKSSTIVRALDDQHGEVARVTSDGKKILVSHGVPEVSLEILRNFGLEPTYGCGGSIALAPLIPGFRGGLRISPTTEGVSIRGRIAASVLRSAKGFMACEYGDFPNSLSKPAMALCSAASESDLVVLQRALPDVM